MKLSVKTVKPKEVVDITDKIESALSELETASGLCNVFVAHTTCAVTTMDLDPGTDLDLLDSIEKIFPAGNYRHPHNPAHVGEHIMASIIGQSQTIPFENRRLILGTWQRVVLIELSGPRERLLIISV